MEKFKRHASHCMRHKLLVDAFYLGLALRGIICNILYPQGSFSLGIHPLYRYNRVHYTLRCQPYLYRIRREEI